MSSKLEQEILRWCRKQPGVVGMREKPDGTCVVLDLQYSKGLRIEADSWEEIAEMIGIEIKKGKDRA